MKHSEYISAAIEEARLAEQTGDIPVGCIIVSENRIIGKGHNTREAEKNALGHAELNAIGEACRALNSWRLKDCTLYVTLEPCPMCMGAILNARIKRVVFGAYDMKAGCCGSAGQWEIAGSYELPEVLGGIRELECAELLRSFFDRLRKDERHTQM